MVVLKFLFLSLEAFTRIYSGSSFVLLTRLLKLWNQLRLMAFLFDYTSKQKKQVATYLQCVGLTQLSSAVEVWSFFFFSSSHFSLESTWITAETGGGGGDVH